MKLLLTGATGFLGSHLTRTLVSCGHEVVILKRSFSDCRRICDLLPQLVCFDVDRLSLSEIFKQVEGISAVIHTATCYGRRGESAADVFASNTLYPLQLLELAVAAGIGRFVNTGTSLDRFLNPYALSKCQFAEWGRLSAEKGDIRFINLELEHFYGPDDDGSKFTTYVIRSCAHDLSELKLTAGAQLRDFIYIDDVVDAYVTVLEGTHSAEESFLAYGVGSGQPVTIRRFVEMVRQLAGATTRLDFGAVPYRVNEVMETCADVTALKSLGWVPRVSLEEGIGRTITAERVKGIVA